MASTLTLAYCEDIAALWADMLRIGGGDWDSRQHEKVQSDSVHNQLIFTSLTRKQASTLAIVLAVISFYVLDFALNALQASLRNLLLDVTPSEQLSAGNAWHSRMTQAGNIVGYGFGFLPLASLPIIRLLGGDQFRKFCVIAIAVLVVTVWITCYTQTEEERILQKPSEGYAILCLAILPALDDVQDVTGNLGQHLHRYRRASKACATSMLRTDLRLYGLVRIRRESRPRYSLI